MPTLTTNYGLEKPLVNSAVDQDLWGDELNDDLDSIDTLLRTGITITPQSSQTSGFTATVSISVKYLYPCNTSGGAFAATLPTAASSGIGATVYIKKTDSSSNAITVTRGGSDTIDGSTTYVINIENRVEGFVSDGVSKWYVLTEGVSVVPDATTSIKGIVQLATSAEVQTGTDTAKTPTPSAIKTAFGFSKYFQSSNISFALDSNADVAHGLGTTPMWWFAYIQCTSAEDNWSVGDQIPITSLENTLNSGIIVAANSTNMRYTIGTGTLSYLNRTAHNNASVTPASWVLVIKAWA